MSQSPNIRTFKIAVFPGDGIGREVMAPCLVLLNDVMAAAGDARLEFVEMEAGADLYHRTGDALPQETLDEAGRADAILLGAMGDPNIRYADGREIAPQVDIREAFQLFAGVRPIRTWPGLPSVLSDPRAAALDVILIRESTEGMFAGRKSGVVTADVAHDTMTITRPASERLFDFAFTLGRRRKAAGHPGRVTCVDKANIFGSFAFFRSIFDERATHYADVTAEHCHVDAAAMHMVRSPWSFDVMVTENLLGDILSDLGAGLMGGMGMAPSADIGAENAVFQPCHGTAPDIVGSGKANPTAMFLSAAMMLDWLGERHAVPGCRTAAGMIDGAVQAAFAHGTLKPFELGGDAGLDAITGAIRGELEQPAG